MRPTPLLFAAALLSVVAAGPAPAGEPQRIVSVGGAITEILYALGEEERIAGVDTTSLFPREALIRKPHVGYMRQLSAEGVLSLSPDLVLMDEGAGPKSAVDLIDAAGVAVTHVPTGYTVEDLARKVGIVAEAVGKPREGAEMAHAIRADLAGLETELRAVTTRKKVLFILSLVDGRPNAAGTGTGADAVIRLAGADNVFGGVEGYKTLSTEALAALQPDAILMVTRPDTPDIDPFAVPALAGTPAGRSGTVIRMDALHLLGFGPRTPGAVRDLAARLYPRLGLAREAGDGR